MIMGLVALEWRLERFIAWAKAEPDGKFCPLSLA